MVEWLIGRVQLSVSVTTQIFKAKERDKDRKKKWNADTNLTALVVSHRQSDAGTWNIGQTVGEAQSP